MGEYAVSPWWALVAAGLVGLGAGAWWLWRRRARSTPLARLAQASERLLSNVLLPHAETGQIHIECLVLTRTGILVLDLRDVAGHVFGSEAMQEWTVLDRSRRYTFANPLPLLYDRIAAVRRVVPDLPVDGLVVFGRKAQFTKGFPPHVRLFESLMEDLQGARGSEDGPPAELLDAGWEALRVEARQA